MDQKENLVKEWLFLYNIALEIAAGSYLAAFLYFYNKLNVRNFEIIQNEYYQTFILTAGTVTLIMAPLFVIFLLIRNSEELPLWYVGLRKNTLWLAGCVLTLYALYLLDMNGYHLRIVELILAFVFIFVFYQFQKNLLEFGFPAWQNFTTTVNLSFGVAKIMLAVWLFLFNIRDLEIWVCALLIAELITVFWRLKTLNSIRPETKQSVRLTLVHYSLLFGLRLVGGIFIPLIFCLYQLFFGVYVLGISVMFILFGELLERFLFVFTAIPDYYDEQQE